MAANVIITRTAARKGTISTGRIYNGKSLTKLSTDILTSVQYSYRCENFVVYNATDKNSNKYSIIELKCSAIVTEQKIDKKVCEINGIGLDPVAKEITKSVSIHPQDFKLLSCDYYTYSINDVTTIKGRHVLVVTVY